MPKVKLTESEVESFEAWQTNRKSFERWLEMERLLAPIHFSVRAPFDMTLRDDPFRWPLLVRASERPPIAAHSTRHEWVVSRGLPEGHTTTNSEYNELQIFRVTWRQIITNAQIASETRYGGKFFGYPNTNRAKMADICDLIETALRDSVRGASDASPRGRTMASIPSLLGRWPTKTDEVRLAILRDITLRRVGSRTPATPDVDGVAFDFEYRMELTAVAVRKD